MRKTVVFILCAMLAISVIMPASAYEDTVQSEQMIASIHGIPNDIWNTIPDDVRTTLVDDADKIVSYSTEVSYVKVVPASDGTSIAIPATFAEYERSTSMRDIDSNDWMQIQTTIVDYGSYGRVSAAFTWLTRPAFRMNDVIGLSITQGTVQDESATGFYSYTTSQGTYSNSFDNLPDEDVDYQGHGVVVDVPLARPNYTVTRDYMLLSCTIDKEGNSEGLNGAYAHQRLSLSLDPDFSIDREGFLSCLGINIGLSYDRFKGYTSTSWS